MHKRKLLRVLKSVGYNSALLSIILGITTYACVTSKAQDIQPTNSTRSMDEVSIGAGVNEDFICCVDSENIVSESSSNFVPMDITAQYNAYVERHIEFYNSDDEISNLKLSVYSEDEIYWNVIYPLAKIIYAEGGNMDDEFQQYVGYVVLNRVESDLYPNTVKSVFFEKGAYAETSIERFKNNMVSDQALENAKVVVEQYFANSMPCSPAMVYQAEFKQGENIIKKGNNYFGCNPAISEE